MVFHRCLPAHQSGRLPGSHCQSVHPTGRPFSRSYGANLPSSLTRTHPSTLVLSHPPTCVGLRYGRRWHPSDGFSGERGSTRLALVSRSLPRASPGRTPATRLAVATPARRRAYLTPSPRKTWASFSGNGISTVCPSPTPDGLGLGPTNPTWMYLPSEPWGIRWEDFSSSSRYSCRHSHFAPLHPRLPARFAAERTLPYRWLFTIPQLRYVA